MYSLLTFAALFGSAYARPASGTVSSQDAPLSLPSNETALYPPYKFTVPVYTPAQQGIPITLNASKHPGSVESTTKVAPPELVAVAVASCGSSLSPSNPSTFWYEQITHDGPSSFIPDGSQWKLFPNVVTDYGANNTSNTPSDRKIHQAINDGSLTQYNRNTYSLGTTGQPAVVYIPGGTYILDNPLQLYMGTVMMGNPLNPPVSKAGPNFSAVTLIHAKDPSQPPTNNFYIAIKNINFDSININPDTTFTTIDCSVAQATQPTNCVFNMPNYSIGHTGVGELERGDSGTIMSDLTFNGGAVGISLGSTNQQYEISLSPSAHVLPESWSSNVLIVFSIT